MLSEKESLALAWATSLHATQRDQAGDPYIWHLLRVAFAVDRLHPRMEAEVCAALLHDAVEDGHVSFADIRETFGPVVAEYVEVLTRRAGEPYEDYVTRVSYSKAAWIKIEDLRDNLREERLRRLPEEQAARLRDRYTAALRMIG